MAQQPQAPLDEKGKLQKKLDEYTQYQWLALMPAWLPGILRLVNHTKTVPGREMYVLMFHVGMIAFGIICFTVVRLQMKKLKAQLAQMENPIAVMPPPIPEP
jgi:hypothetical protein